MLPKALYHGSTYAQVELKPGIERSGKLVQWDEVEDNTWLYATTDKDTAIDLGFASALEHKYGLDHFQTIGDTVAIQLALVDGKKQKVSVDDLFRELEVYLYEIRPTAAGGWVHNDNGHNQLTTEWKTQRTIWPYRQATRVDLASHFRNRKIVI